MNDYFEFGRFMRFGIVGWRSGQREPFSFRGQFFGKREVRTERKRIPERKRR